MAKAAYDNVAKRETRQTIVAIAKNHFKERSISMLELLGQGVGLEYYLQNLDVKWATAIERDKANWDKYLGDNSLRALGYGPRSVGGSGAWISHFCRERSPAGNHNVAILRREDLYQYLENYNSTTGIDFVNFDFCGHFHMEDMITCKPTGQIIEKAFERKVIANGGLLATTFMIGGYTLDISRYKDRILTSAVEITNSIRQLAERNGYTVDVDPAFGVYRSNGRTTMMYSVFKCDLAA